MYQIIDSRTGQRVGQPYQTIRKAMRRADKLDLAYGAARYIVVRLEMIENFADRHELANRRPQ